MPQMKEEHSKYQIVQCPKDIYCCSLLAPFEAVPKLVGNSWGAFASTRIPETAAAPVAPLLELLQRLFHLLLFPCSTFCLLNIFV